VDLRALRPLLGLTLIVGVTACAERSTSSAATGGTAGKPASVRYLEYGSAGGRIPPADSLVNPLAADPDAAGQGEKLFASMNCDGCHAEGAGGFVGPSLVDGRWRYGGGDGAVYQSIFYGRPHGMPAYGGLLSAATIWQLVTYLRAQPVPTVVPTVSWE
jgi:mono/diheme cytochrome c family protein